MIELIVYDKVSWHYPDGTNCPSLSTAKKHFEVVMEWLQTHGFLSDEGKEIFELGISADFSITSTMLNKEGNLFFGDNYHNWIKTLSYSKAADLNILDDWLKNYNYISK